jgi:hypothetical protein
VTAADEGLNLHPLFIFLNLFADLLYKPRQKTLLLMGFLWAKMGSPMGRFQMQITSGNCLYVI